MFDKILYPTDFSESAAKVIAYIKTLHQVGTREVVILNVIHQRTLDTLETIHSSVFFSDGRYEQDSEKAIKALEHDREQKLAPVVEELKTHGFVVKALVKKGVPRRVILKMEAEEGVSAIIMGSHGRSRKTGLLIGSVSEKVVRSSKTTVIVVK